METFKNSILEKEQVIIPDLEKRFREAEEELFEYRIKKEAFIGLYDEESMRKDQEKVDHIKRGFMKKNTTEDIEAKKLAIVFEAVFNECAELHNWLGENTFVYPTNEFDDIVNGIDMVAEFNEDDKITHYLGLGIDVTYSTHIKKKFQKIKEKIDKGTLSEIKYFHLTQEGEKKEGVLNRSNFTGKMSQIPSVVVSVSKTTLKELIDFRENKKKKELDAHFVQFQILEQIMKQLEVFIQYAKKIGKEDIARQFEMANQIISLIYEGKKGMLEDNGKRDGSMETLSQQLESVFKE